MSGVVLNRRSTFQNRVSRYVLQLNAIRHTASLDQLNPLYQSKARQSLVKEIAGGIIGETKRIKTNRGSSPSVITMIALVILADARRGQAGGCNTDKLLPCPNVLNLAASAHRAGVLEAVILLPFGARLRPLFFSPLLLGGFYRLPHPKRERLQR